MSVYLCRLVYVRFGGVRRVDYAARVLLLHSNIIVLLGRLRTQSRSRTAGNRFPVRTNRNGAKLVQYINLYTYMYEYEYVLHHVGEGGRVVRKGRKTAVRQLHRIMILCTYTFMFYTSRLWFVSSCTTLVFYMNRVHTTDHVEVLLEIRLWPLCAYALGVDDHRMTVTTPGGKKRFSRFY
jgi:hypothetical protein